MTSSSPSAILYQGYLVKRGDVLRTWKRRWLVLNGARGTLQVFETADATSPVGEIDVDKVYACRFSERNPYGHGSAFELVTRRRVVHLVADDAEQVQLWMQAIGNCKIMRASDDPAEESVSVEFGSASSEWHETATATEHNRGVLPEHANDDDEPRWENQWINDGFDSDGEVKCNKRDETVSTTTTHDTALHDQRANDDNDDDRSSSPAIEPVTMSTSTSFVESDVRPVVVQEPIVAPAPASPLPSSSAVAPSSASSSLYHFKQFHKRRPEWESFHQRAEQARAFVAWTNHWLAKANVARRVEDLCKDLRDGELLSELLRFFMARQGVALDAHLNCESLVGNQGEESIVLVLRRFFKAFRESAFAQRAYLPPTINAAGVASGAVKVVFDTVWALFLAFDVESGIDTLLQWHAAAVPSMPLSASSSEEAPLELSALFDGARLRTLIQSRVLGIADGGHDERRVFESTTEQARAAFELASKHLHVAAFLDASESDGARDAAAAIMWLALVRQALEDRE
jgi:hypothetical protein